MKMLEGIVVLDFTQFLSGPSAGLRLADLGARVIKIEHPEKGDLCRSLYVSDCDIEGESSIFQAINRNKESVALDLKNLEQKALVEKLIKKADVVLNNFRPGVMKRLGLDYAAVKAINPSIVYGEVSGYGDTGPWSGKPGQDLLLQAVSGLTWLSGNSDDGPVPMGVAVVDILSGAQLAQGVLAALYSRGVSSEGMLVQVNMLEAALDFQCETLTMYYHDGNQPVERNKQNGAHPLVGGAYGLYKTKDGYVCISMGGIPQLGELLKCDALLAYQEPKEWFSKRDEIKAILNAHVLTGTTQQWLDVLEPADIWCSDVFNWKDLLEHDGFKATNMLQDIALSSGGTYQTTRCPIRIDGEPIFASKGAPKLGEHNEAILSGL